MFSSGIAICGFKGRFSSNLVRDFITHHRPVAWSWSGGSLGGPSAKCVLARGSAGMPPPGIFDLRRSEINSVAFWDTFPQQTWSYSRYRAWTLLRQRINNCRAIGFADVQTFYDGSWSQGNITPRLRASQTSCSTIIALCSFFWRQVSLQALANSFPLSLFLL